MKVLILGKSGQLGNALSRLVWPADFEIVQISREDLNVGDLVSVAPLILRIAPDIVINATAYTNVERAEIERDIAMLINKDAPLAIATACRDINAGFLHVSTDYVFDGSKEGAYVEGDTMNPICAYGLSKALGEEEIRKNLDRHVIIRTSWVFSDHGSNFVKTMLRLGAERNELFVVGDQLGGPTSAIDIAKMLRQLLVGKIGDSKFSWGTYHYAGAPAVSWLDFAREIFELNKDVAPLLRSISTAEYLTSAKRPLNSVLDGTKLLKTFGIAKPDWKVSLKKVINDLRDRRS